MSPQSHTKNIIWHPNFISKHIFLSNFVENNYRCPLPVIWPKSPRLPQIMLRLQHHLLRMPCPWLQEGRPRHIASQWALWWGCRPGRQSLYTNSRAQWPPHIFRLGLEEDKGKPGQVQNHTINTAAKCHGTEGRPTDPWPLTEWDI